MTRARRTLILLILAMVPVVQAGCGGGSGPAPTGATTATTPGAVAPPARVVAAYLAAINAGDAPAAMRLVTPRFGDRLAQEVDSPLTNWVRVTGIRIGTPRPDRDVGSARRYRRAVFVPVTFTLRQRREVSMRNGPTTWGYVLVRNDTADPWRIDDEGT